MRDYLKELRSGREHASNINYCDIVVISLDIITTGVGNGRKRNEKGKKVEKN